MKKSFLASFLLFIGLTSPVKAEPEWVEYHQSIIPFQTKLKKVRYIDKNILISNDGITIYAEKQTNKRLRKGSDKEYSKAQWKGINCKTRILARETGSESLFYDPIPNLEKMSKKEIKNHPLAIQRYWNLYKLVCQGNNPTNIKYKAIDILDSMHPYNKDIYQSNLDTTGLTYNQFQSQLIRHKKKDPDFDWYNWNDKKNDKLYLPIGPVNQPKININNKSSKYKRHLLSDNLNLDKYTKKQLEKMRVICLDYTEEFSHNPKLVQKHKITCNRNFPLAKKKRFNKSKDELARDKCLKAKDYAGCMEYEMSN